MENYNNDSICVGILKPDHEEHDSDQMRKKMEELGVDFGALDEFMTLMLVAMAKAFKQGGEKDV